MRITYVYDGSYPSSQADAWQVLNTVCALSRAGAKVRLIFSREKDAAPLDLDSLIEQHKITGDVELLELPSLGMGGRVLAKLSHPAKALWMGATKDSDVVYSRNIPAIVMANLTGQKVVYDTYRPWPSQYKPMKLFFRALFANLKMLGAFFHSHLALRSFASAGIDPRKLKVAHNGYNQHFFADKLSTHDARIILNLDTKPFTIGYTGRLDSEKGIHTLLDIVEKTPEFHLLLVGGGDQPEVMSRIDRLTNVTLFPWQTPSTLAPFLFACDCLMIPPSKAPLEAGNTVLPMKLFGYFAAGRTIVAPRAPDTEELLHHQENAWLLKAGDIDDAIVQLQYLRSHPEERKALAKKAQEDSLKMTWDHRAQLLLNQIEEWMR